jgi:GTP cyclohydrolase IB
MSGVKGVLDYEVTFLGELIDGSPRRWVKVAVPVTSLRPCSKTVAAYGVHYQRSRVTLTACT